MLRIRTEQTEQTEQIELRYKTMEEKAKTYLESGVLLIISAICAYFTKTLHFMTYTNSIAGVIIIILSFRMRRKSGDAADDGMEESAAEVSVKEIETTGEQERGE